MLEEMQCAIDKVFVWPDKKFLTMEAVFNCQNNRFMPLHQKTFPKVSEHISSQRNQLVSCFGLLLLLMVQNNRVYQQILEKCISNNVLSQD